MLMQLALDGGTWNRDCFLFVFTDVLRTSGTLESFLFSTHYLTHTHPPIFLPTQLNQYSLHHQSEAPAPTPAPAPPAVAAPVVPTVEAPKPPAVPFDATASKRKNPRQSLSVPKGSQEAIAHPAEQPTHTQHGAAVGAPPGTVGYQGLPQIGSPPSALRELPALRDAPPNKREELFKLKLQLCGVIFSFDDPTSDKRGKV